MLCEATDEQDHLMNTVQSDTNDNVTKERTFPRAKWRQQVPLKRR
jgi:hypothetical protein